MNGRIFLCGLVVLALCTASADASVLQARNNRIDFLNWEGIGLAPHGTDAAPAAGTTPIPPNIGVQPDPGLIGDLDVGDTLDGVFQAQTMAGGLYGIVDVTLTGASPTAVTAFFSIMAATKTPGIVAGSWDYTFVPNPAFAGVGGQFPGLPAGTMLAVYEETGPTAQDFTNNSATHLLDIANITDGNLLGAFGVSGPASTAYWVSPTGSDTIANLPVGANFFFYGLDYLAGSINPALILAQTNPFVNPVTYPVTAPHVLTASDLVGKGNVSSLAGGTLPNYDAFSNDPALIRLIPEPGSVLIWFLLGVIGLVLVHRRRR